MKNKKNKWKLFRKSRKGLELDFLGWLIIAVIFLVVGILILILLKGKGAGAMGYILEMFKFGK